MICNAYYDYSPKGGPETGNRESREKMGDQEQEEYVYHYGKEAERDEDERKSQNFENRPDEEIDETQGCSGEDEFRRVPVKNKSRHQPIGNGDSQAIGKNIENNPS